MSRKFSLKPPVLLDSFNSTDSFDCGSWPLNEYIKKFALINNQHRSARTYVAVKNAKLAGYYTLTIGSVNREETPERVSKGLAKHPVPLVIIARLAVDKGFQGKGLGKALLRDALLRVIESADIIGGRAVFVQAKDEEAKNFYLQFGFEPAPTDPFHLYMLIKDIKKTIQV